MWSGQAAFRSLSGPHQEGCKYDSAMRTTVDLPPALHRRAVELAKRRGQSLSATLAELAARGLSQLDAPMVVRSDPVSGFPVISVGRRVTSDDVAAVLDED